MTLTLILTGMTLLFLVLLGAKRYLRRMCVLCVAVSGMWIVLLAMLLLGYVDDRIIIAILMGESVVGLYYYLSSKVPEKIKIYRFPYILTATAIVYLILVPEALSWQPVILLASVWILFSIPLVSSVEQLESIGKKIVECCREW